jgi:hypothetical protein
MLRSHDYRREEVPPTQPILVRARAFRRKFHQQRCGFFELASCSLRLIYYRNLVCKILEGVCLWGREVNGLTLSVLKFKDLLGRGRTLKNCDSWRMQH